MSTAEIRNELKPLATSWFSGPAITLEALSSMSDDTLPLLPYTVLLALVTRIRELSGAVDVECTKAMEILTMLESYVEQRERHWQTRYSCTSAFHNAAHGHWGGHLPSDVADGSRSVGDAKEQIKQAKLVLADSGPLAQLLSASDTAVFWHSLFKGVRSAHP